MFNLIPWIRNRNELGPTTSIADPVENNLAQLRDEFNSLIEQFWNGNRGGRFGGHTWDLGVDETDREYVVRAEAPGFEAEDFDVQVRGNQLIVRAEHKEEKKAQHGSSWRYGQYHRTVPLPYGAQTDKINARYHSGILELHVPKGEESQGKRIAVEAK